MAHIAARVIDVLGTGLDNLGKSLSLRTETAQVVHVSAIVLLHRSSILATHNTRLLISSVLPIVERLCRLV